MQRCSKSYGVFLDGRWVWYPTQQAAARAEAVELRRRVQAKQAEGKMVILTADRMKQLEDPSVHPFRR